MTTISVTLMNGSTKCFGAESSPLLCEHDKNPLRPVDIINRKTGEVLVGHGEWKAAEIVTTHPTFTTKVYFEAADVKGTLRKEFEYV